MKALKDWMLSFIGSSLAPWALFCFAFAESSFFPIPPDIMIIPMAITQPSQAAFIALMATLGSFLGALFGYSIGYYGGYPLLKKFVKKEKIERIHNYYDRYNAWAVGIAGITPLPFKLFTLSGGTFRINLKIFLLATLVSRGARFFAVSLVSAMAGEALKPLILKYINLFSIIFVVLLLGGFLWASLILKKGVKHGS